MTMLDQTRAVRSGEELDSERLRPILEEVTGLEGQPISVEQFPGGHSNLTYLVRAGERELVLRRPPFGAAIKSAHDMSREYRVLSRLAPAYEKAPKPVAFSDDHSIIGADFYLMEPVRGLILRREPPPELTIDEPLARALSLALIDTLAELHAIDYKAIGLGDLGHPEGYVERQVRGWSERYRRAKTNEIAEVEAVADWLAAKIPTSRRASIIHNDFKFDNLVLDPDDPTRVLAILDWEMCTVGDPLMDLGTTLAYWVEAGDPAIARQFRFGPTTLPGMLSRRELAERYAAQSGASLADLTFYQVFGLFKTAVVAQQIYTRFERGHTKDPRFAAFIEATRSLASSAAALLAG